jgi:GTP diphosphokinase / guanosine-3',5'-bis(diphosphate) 3'-diphosphatase
MRDMKMKDLTLITKALKFASEKHSLTRRKGTELPYINHPIEVMDLLVQYASVSDSILLSGALMHDVIEDEGVTKTELLDLFGEDVADLVDEVSDDPDLSRSEQISALLEKAPKLSLRAALLKLADKTSNIRSVIETPPPWQRSTKIKYLKQSKAVVEALPILPDEAKPLLDLFYETFDKGMRVLKKKVKTETIKRRILDIMKRSGSSIFFIEDFISKGDEKIVSKVLGKLIEEEKLIRVGRGIFVKARRIKKTGEVIPDHINGSDGALIEILQRLNEPFEIKGLSGKYLIGESNQVAARLIIKPTNKKFTRKLRLGDSEIN